MAVFRPAVDFSGPRAISESSGAESSAWPAPASPSPPLLKSNSLITSPSAGGHAPRGPGPCLLRPGDLRRGTLRRLGRGLVRLGRRRSGLLRLDLLPRLALGVRILALKEDADGHLHFRVPVGGADLV